MEKAFLPDSLPWKSSPFRKVKVERILRTWYNETADCAVLQECADSAGCTVKACSHRYIYSAGNMARMRNMNDTAETDFRFRLPRHQAGSDYGGRFCSSGTL